MDQLVHSIESDTHLRVSTMMNWQSKTAVPSRPSLYGLHIFSTTVLASLLFLTAAYLSLPGQASNAMFTSGRDIVHGGNRTVSSSVSLLVSSSSSAAASSAVLTPAARREIRVQKKLSTDPSFKPAAPEASSSASSVAPWTKRGVYLTAASVHRSDFFVETQDSVKQHAGNAVIFDVKGTSVFFDTSSPLAKQYGLVRSLYDLPAIIKTLHEKDIYAIGRFIAVSDSGLTQAVPETRLRNPKTGRVISEFWIDPANQTAIDYNMQVLCDIASSGIDEVNLDYIRFSTENPQTLSVYSGKEKADRVEVFVKSARETIDRCNPSVKLGLSTYAILGWNYPVNLETLGQDVVRFAPYVDVISPMAYPATFSQNAYYTPGKNRGSRMYYLVYRTLIGYRDLLPETSKHKLRPWIQGYGVSIQNMKDQIQAVYDAGSCGYTVWNANNNYVPVYAAMKSVAPPQSCNEMQSTANW